jgi:hypothetical protein
VRELQDGPDKPDDGGRAERGIRDAGAAGERIEPRSRSEYAADLERDVNREAVRRFEPSRAGLPGVSAADAAAYLDASQAGRPWLAAARGCSPEVQRVFAALDQGGGHAHIRHEGWVTEEMNRRRVAYLEDPAQLDAAKRAAGIDGLKSPEGLHRCRETSSRITDSDAFAGAFAHGIEHPIVKAALETKFTAGRVPRPISLPIIDLLGPDGHRYCTGWRLQPVEGSMNTARGQRAAWVDARGHDRQPAGPRPDVRAVQTFEGGTIVFAFGPSAARDGYEVITMYPSPRRDQQQGDSR